MKRICIFAGYNQNHVIQEYVFDYLEQLSKHSDVYYIADGGAVAKKYLNRLLLICKGVFFVKHGMYDFGSYSLGCTRFIGWEHILQYDELIFANDSCFCVQDFGVVFNKMSKSQADVWGLLCTDERNYDYYSTLENYVQKYSEDIPYFCIGTYFIVFRRNVVETELFQKFVALVKKEKNRYDVCMKYEMGLTKLLIKERFQIDAFIDVVYRNACIYNEQGIRLLKQGFPLVKTKIFKDNPLSIKNLEFLPNIIFVYTGNKNIFQYICDIYKIKAKEITTNSKSVFNLIGVNSQINITKLFQRKHDDYSKHQSLIEANNCNSYVIFFNVARDAIGGGMLSINRFIDESIKLFVGSNKKVLLSGLPLKNEVVSYTLFDSRLPMYHFDDIVNSIRPNELILHIPEYYLPEFLDDLKKSAYQWLLSIPYLHINIMDQNHDYMPIRLHIERCKEITDKVTVTMAHERYTTEEIANAFDCPIKKLMPFIPEFYRVPYSKKIKKIAISPDQFVFDGVSKKDEAMSYLINHLPDYEIFIINNISLEEYKRIIANSLFTITFGEGYDGYFIEPFLSNSVAFAVYNETFFPSNFKGLPTIYDSYQHFLEKIIIDIRFLESHPKEYVAVSKLTEQKIKEITNDDISKNDLIDFYANKYDFIPEIPRRTGYYHPVG